MELSSRSIGTVQVLLVQGRIDHAHANAFEVAMAPYLAACQGEQSLVLNFSGVPFISSVGLRVLMLAAKQVKTQQGRLAIAALTPIVAEVFQVSRFNLVLRVFDTPDAAAAALSS